MSFKTFDLSADVASVVSSINEVVSISSSIYKNDLNIKYYNNIASSSALIPLGGYWESVYDSSPTSSLSTALVDFTYGYQTGSLYNVAASVSSSQTEKIKVYRMMASTLLGDPDAAFTINSGSQNEALFLMIKRNISKDEIKKGTTSITFLSASTYVTGSDDGAPVSFKQGPGGDYAPLKLNGTGAELGQIWYQAGIIVIPDNTYSLTQTWSGSVSLQNSEYSSSINQVCDGFRSSMNKINFHNQTNMFSTVYFCRAQNTEFNYSSNPTFTDDNLRIRVTSGSNILQTRTYITTVGLYSANDELLAVAKLNKPVTKSPDSESIMRIRLDY